MLSMATNDNTEHSVLLQTVSKSGLIASLEHDDALNQLNKHVDQIRKLAMDHEGRALPKDAKTYLKEIKALAASMLDQLRIDHTASQKAVGDALVAVNKCNIDHADALDSVTALLKDAREALKSHDICRETEIVMKRRTDVSCKALGDQLDTARACSAKEETKAFAKYKSTVGTIDAVGNLEAQAKACDDDLGHYENTVTECKKRQLTAEKGTCEAHAASYGKCGAFDDCQATTRKLYNEQVCVDMVAPRDARKSQALAANTITCLTDKLLSADTKEHAADLLSACDISKTDQAKVTKEFDITCEKPDDSKVCEWPAKPPVIPGTSEWFDDNYKKDWIALATNDVASGALITEVQHECDKMPPLSANSKPPVPEKEKAE